MLCICAFLRLKNGRDAHQRLDHIVVDNANVLIGGQHNSQSSLMERFVIQGNTRVHGEIAISGSKNAALPILAAVLLCDGATVVDNLPQLQDVATSLELLGSLGVELGMAGTRRLEANPRQVHSLTAPYELVRKMRASILVLGPMLTRFGEANVSFPGGCAIGSRPVDIHLQGLRALGASIEIEDGFIRATVDGRLHGTTICMPMVSVGATENLMMAAALAKGTTRLENAACEPEISDLANCLNAWGARVTGAGTQTIVIEGVERMPGGYFRVMPDRIETGTYLAAAAATRGSIRVTDADPSTLEQVLQTLRATGAYVALGADWISLDMQGRRPLAVDLVTAPYPGFPTDMQAQLTVVNAVADGVGRVTETIFENRFMQIQELRRMGADIVIDANTATVKGVNRLKGTRVLASDLRASASLIIAALAADGETCIDDIHYVDRGYECIEAKLHQLGVQIIRMTSE